jgi:integrase/recombinase XerD
VQGKQAKIVSPTQERAILGYLETTRYPSRDRVIFLLSMKAGLRAKEMASLTWAMVTDAAGQITEAIHLQNRASKGKTGGRTIPMHPDLQAALILLQTARGTRRARIRPCFLGARWGCRQRRCACGSIGSIPAEDGRLLVALGPPDLHYPRRP